MTDYESKIEWLELQIRRINYSASLYEEKLREILGEDEFSIFVLECVKKIAEWEINQHKKEDHT